MIEGDFKAKCIGSNSDDMISPKFISGDTYNINIRNTSLGICVSCDDKYLCKFYPNTEELIRNWLILSKYMNNENSNDKCKEDNMKETQSIIGKRAKVMYKGISKDFEGRYGLRPGYIYNIEVTEIDTAMNTMLRVDIDGIPSCLYYSNVALILKDWDFQYNEDEIVEVEEKNIEESYNKPKVITLCGSSKYKDKFYEVQRKLTLQGYIVLSLDFFIKAETTCNEDIIKLQRELKDRNLMNPIMEDFLKTNYLETEYPSLKDLVRIHNAKIDMSDAIFVINVENYIGNNTLDEVEYAHSKGKKVFYLSKYPDMKIPSVDWE